MKVHIKIQGTAKALNERDRAGAGGFVGAPCQLDQVCGNDAIDDAQYLAHDGGPGGEQKAQLIGKA